MLQVHSGGRLVCIKILYKQEKNMRFLLKFLKQNAFFHYYFLKLLFSQ